MNYASFFFGIHDGVQIDDLNGIELQSDDAAIEHARQTVAGMIASHAFGGREHLWIMTVRDEHGETIQCIHFDGIMVDKASKRA